MMNFDKMDLQTIKNNYAQEQGYPNWNELKYWRDISEVADGYMNEICIRAQKAALEKAAKTAEIEHHNIRTGIKNYASGMGGYGQVYTVDRISITNPENLIR